MSYRLQELALLTKADLTPIERLVLVALAYFADDEAGLAKPGVDGIAQTIHCNEKSVRRALKALESKQLIECIERGRGRGKVSAWRILAVSDADKGGRL